MSFPIYFSDDELMKSLFDMAGENISFFRIDIITMSCDSKKFNTKIRYNCVNDKECRIN